MRQWATTGGAARRAVRLLPRPAWTVKAGCSAAPSARWPIELLALPPDSLQVAFSAAGGRLNGSVRVAGSTSTSPSDVSTGIRSPRTGVLGLPFLNTPQLLEASAAAISSATRSFLDLVILVLLGLRS